MCLAFDDFFSPYINHLQVCIMSGENPLGVIRLQRFRALFSCRVSLNI